MNKIHGVGYLSGAQVLCGTRHSLQWQHLFWLLQAIGRLIIAPMMKHVGEKKIFVFHAFGTVVFLVVAILGSTSVSLIAFALVGYFTCASFTSIFSAAINSLSTNHGTISGILNTAIVGGVFGGWLVGAIGGLTNMKWGMLVNLIAFLYVFGLAVWGTGTLDVAAEGETEFGK